MHPVFLLTGGYFVIGAVAILLIDRRSAGSGRKERWTKFAVYFLVVHAVIVAILAGRQSTVALAVVVVALGLGELLRAAARRAEWSVHPLALVFPAYAALAFAFVRFAQATSAARILFVYVVVLTFDGFSQITGQMFGRRKLAPRVSPGKTVEGLGGGLVMAAVTALPLSGWTGLDRGHAVAIALLVAVAALAGDLAASYVKRTCGVKDYGTWIPGHGGVLDRFDSFIAAGGVYWSLVGR